MVRFLWCEIGLQTGALLSYKDRSSQEKHSLPSSRELMMGIPNAFLLNKSISFTVFTAHHTSGGKRYRSNSDRLPCSFQQRCPEGPGPSTQLGQMGTGMLEPTVSLQELGRRDPSKRDGCIEADAASSLCSYCAIRFGRLNRHNIHRSANELS